MGPLSLVGVPTSAGSHHAGQDLAPAALRDLGLVERLRERGLDVEDTGDAEGVVWRPDVPSAPARLLTEVTRVAAGVADAVTREAARGRVALVLGGDCTITLGVVAGLRRTGPVGLVYLDGDADVTLPGAGPGQNGVLDSMGVAHLLGLAEDDLSRVGPVFPLLSPDDLVLLGYDPGDLGESGRERLAATGARAVAYDELGTDPAGHVSAALDHLAHERLVVHLDVDVVDGRDLALANFPHYATGVDLTAATRALTTALADPRVAAVVLTEVNPTHDPSGVLLGRYLDAVVGAFPRLRAPSGG